MERSDWPGRGRASGGASPDGEGEAAYYGRLETGARWLAGRAASAGERCEHLGHADRYLHLRLESAPGGR
jgi:hypothetical protein